MQLEAASPVQVFREQNQVADLLADKGKKAMESGHPSVLQVPPMFVRAVLNADMLGSSFTRLVTNNILDLSSRVVAENTNILNPASTGETSSP